jgi:vacuolar protein sorting-associated protein 13A/C
MLSKVRILVRPKALPYLTAVGLAGHLGKFSLSLHWMNLGNQPVQVLVEDVYLLVVPSPASSDDPAEEQKRAQAAKMDRVKNAELLNFRGAPEKGKHEFFALDDVSEMTLRTDDSAQSQGLVASLIAKILNNLQVTVKNVHVRYEDRMSVPNVGLLRLSNFFSVT